MTSLRSAVSKLGNDSVRERVSTIALFAIALVVGLAVPIGVRSILTLMAVYSIYAMAYGMVLGYADQPSLGHGLFFGLGAYAMILTIQGGDAGFWSGVGMAVLLGLAAGAAVGAVSVRLTDAFHVIITALFAAVAHLLSNAFTPLTGGSGGLTAQVPDVPLLFTSVSVYDSVTNFLVPLVFAVITYVAVSRLVRSPTGMVFLSVRENEGRAASLGYNVYAYKLLAFTVSAGLTALSGALYAVVLRYTSTEFFGFTWSVIPFVWVLIGGTGTLVGPIIGVIVLTVFQFYVSEWWTHYLIILGVLMLMLLRWGPRGVVGLVRARLESFDELLKGGARGQ